MRYLVMSADHWLKLVLEQFKLVLQLLLVVIYLSYHWLNIWYNYITNKVMPLSIHVCCTGFLLTSLWILWSILLVCGEGMFVQVPGFLPRNTWLWQMVPVEIPQGGSWLNSKNRTRERQRKRWRRRRKRRRRRTASFTWLTDVAIPLCSCIWSSLGSHGSLVRTFLRSPILLVMLVMATSSGSSSIWMG